MTQRLSHFVLYCNGTDREATADELGLPSPRHDNVELYRREVDVTAEVMKPTPYKAIDNIMELSQRGRDRLDQRALICDTCQATLRIRDEDMNRLIVISAQLGELRQEVADFRALYRRAAGRKGPAAK